MSNKYGIELPVGLGTPTKENLDYTTNKRADGIRLDYRDLSGDEYVSAAIVGYFALTNAPNDEISGKFSAMPHSANNRVQCYDLGVHNLTGKSRWRFEPVHPQYTGDVDNGEKGIRPNGRFLGYCFVRRNLPDGNVELRIYQDTGDNEADRPANDWKLIMSSIDTQYRCTEYEDGHEVTLRIDKVDENLQRKWVTLFELS